MYTPMLIKFLNYCREKADDKNEHSSPIMLSCAKALLSACNIDELLVEKNLSEGGSLFNSPSASVAAYMVTGHPAVLKYVESVVQNFPSGGLSSVFFIHKRFAVHTFS